MENNSRPEKLHISVYKNHGKLLKITVGELKFVVADTRLKPAHA
jgi:hypothetical protein